MPKRKANQREREDRRVQVLLDNEQRNLINEEAAIDGVGASTWLRTVGLQEAARRRAKREVADER